METFVEFALIYLAVGAVLFALIPGQATPDDFHWRNQADFFRNSVPEVLTWPLVLSSLSAGLFRLTLGEAEFPHHLVSQWQGRRQPRRLDAV